MSTQGGGGFRATVSVSAIPNRRRAAGTHKSGRFLIRMGLFLVLVAALAAMLGRPLVDGISSRLNETRETSRYLIGVLVFLGLLGTFYGLLETVRSVGGVLGALNIGGSDVARAFSDLKNGLQSPLHGMATAFSASLFGL